MCTSVCVQVPVIQLCLHFFAFHRSACSYSQVTGLRCACCNAHPESTHVCTQLITSIVGGYDTTGTATAWTLWRLARHPKAQSLIQQEIDRVTNGRVSGLLIISAVVSYGALWNVLLRSASCSASYSACLLHGGSHVVCVVPQTCALLCMGSTNVQRVLACRGSSACACAIDGAVRFVVTLCRL